MPFGWLIGWALGTQENRRRDSNGLPHLNEDEVPAMPPVKHPKTELKMKKKNFKYYQKPFDFKYYQKPFDINQPPPGPPCEDVSEAFGETKESKQRAFEYAYRLQEHYNNLNESRE